MKRLTPGRLAGVLVSLLILLGLVSSACLFTGPVPVAPGDVFDRGTTGHVIFWQHRLPRILTAALVGGMLALAGAVLQALLRNPLATPFTLGITGGSAFGAVLALRMGWDIALLGIGSVPLFAFAGACGAVLLILGVAWAGGELSTATLLLAGVTVNFLFSSLVLLLQYTAEVTHSFQMVRWLMGGIDAVGYETLLKSTPFLVAGALPLLWHGRTLNLLGQGEEVAANLGVPVERTRLLIIYATALIIGVTVAIAGPVGFVGLIIPHIMRILLGGDHRLLLPASVLAGATFLIACDSAARTLLAPAEIPVGILTAACGAPFFLWLLVRRRTA